MLYSCTHMATEGVSGLTEAIASTIATATAVGKDDVTLGRNVT